MLIQQTDRCTVSFICWLRCHRKRLWWLTIASDSITWCTHSLLSTLILLLGEIDFHNSQTLSVGLFSCADWSLRGSAHSLVIILALAALLLFVSLLRTICLWASLYYCHLWPLQWAEKDQGVTGSNGRTWKLTYDLISSAVAFHSCSSQLCSSYLSGHAYQLLRLESPSRLLSPSLANWIVWCGVRFVGHCPIVAIELSCQLSAQTVPPWARRTIALLPLSGIFFLKRWLTFGTVIAASARCNSWHRSGRGLVSSCLLSSISLGTQYLSLPLHWWSHLVPTHARHLGTSLPSQPSLLSCVICARSAQLLSVPVPVLSLCQCPHCPLSVLCHCLRSLQCLNKLLSVAQYPPVLDTR